MSAKYVYSPSDIPLGEHWAIIEGSSITVPGDERSRTNPGHGYPESTERFITYAAYSDKAEFEQDLKVGMEPRFSFGRSIIGIHVAGIFRAKTDIVLEEKR